MDRNRNTPILSKRTFLGTLLIFFGVFACLGIAMMGAFTPCIYNYYSYLVVYPDATQISQEASLANYFGFGELSSTWFVADDADTVREWYVTTITEAERAKRRAIIDNDEPPPISGRLEGPPVWEGVYNVRATDGGAEIILSANCY
jgi:hypothetical protein